MTSPIEDITVQCPKCRNLYKDWYRASVNLDLDPFDDEYLDQCSAWSESTDDKTLYTSRRGCSGRKESHGQDY